MRPSYSEIQAVLVPCQLGTGGRAALSKVFYTGRPLRPKVQPLTFLYTIFDRKRSPFGKPSIGKWYLFDIRS